MTATTKMVLMAAAQESRRTYLRIQVWVGYEMTARATAQAKAGRKGSTIR
jgi:hypothetical protein